jgi:hypothetical protein
VETESPEQVDPEAVHVRPLHANQQGIVASSQTERQEKQITAKEKKEK